MARHVTTQFHKLTRQREQIVAAARGAGDEEDTTTAQIDAALQAMGGRVAYQKASQVSTSFHSTSKWVLSHLSRNGWVYGILVHDDATSQLNNNTQATSKKKVRRPTRLLEVGAINTELLDASHLFQIVSSNNQKTT